MENEVSVIMPVYNAQEFLAEALQSLLVQTHQIFELIAEDGGSTDGSAEILADFARRDKRIAFSQTERRGVGAAINSCLEKARNDLVVRLDADDLMLSNRLERQVWFMQQHPDVSVASSYAWLIDRNGRLLAEAKPTVDIDRGLRDRDPQHFVGLIQPACIMRKKDIQAVGGYSTELPFADDREMWGRLAASGYRLAVQPEFLIKQRLHRSSGTATSIRRNILVCEFIDHNILRSFHGQAYVSFETFLAHRKGTPVLKRLARGARESSKAFYTAATRDFAERDWWPFLVHSTSAICLNPSWGLRMVKRVAHRKTSSV